MCGEYRYLWPANGCLPLELQKWRDMVQSVSLLLCKRATCNRVSKLTGSMNQPLESRVMFAFYFHSFTLKTHLKQCDLTQNADRSF